jgi:hypothetical protein
VGQHLDKYKELLDKKSMIVDEMNKERIEKYREIAPKDKKFQVLVYNHMQSIMDE